MTAKHVPATSLPWAEPVNYGASKFEVQGPNSRLATADKLPDAAHIVHAANAYPKLVEACNVALSGAVDCGTYWKVDMDDIAKLRALIRELGEAD